MSFDNLPTEIQHMILCHLNQSELCNVVAPVSRKWRQLAFDLHFWKRVTIPNNYSWKWTNDIPQEIRNGVRKIEIQTTVSPKTMSSVVDNFPNIEELSFAVTFSKDVTASLSQMSTALKLMTDLTKQIIRWRRLKSISINGCNFFTLDIELIVNKCSGIEVIELEDYHRINQWFVYNLVNIHKATLRKLHLLSVGFKDVDFRSISKCSTLTSLKLLKAKHLTDSALFFLKELKFLETFAVVDAPMLSNDAFEKFFTRCQFEKLKELRLVLVPFTNAAAAFLSSSCRQLRVLILKDNGKSFTDNGLNEIVSSCYNLQQLTISDNEKMSGNCLMKIPQYLPLLCRLEFENLPMINREITTQLRRIKPHLDIIISTSAINSFNVIKLI